MTQAQRSPADQLYDRIEDALGAHDVHPDDRAKILAAYGAAGIDTATWEDLPADARALIEEAEKLPRESWDDPSEVPDHVFRDAGVDV